MNETHEHWGDKGNAQTGRGNKQNAQTKLGMDRQMDRQMDRRTDTQKYIYSGAHLKVSELYIGNHTIKVGILVDWETKTLDTGSMRHIFFHGMTEQWAFY